MKGRHDDDATPRAVVRPRQVPDRRAMAVAPESEGIGNAAAFLCSNEASMVSGVAMEVDGGRCI